MKRLLKKQIKKKNKNMFIKPTKSLGTPSFPEQDDRTSEMDMMWLLEKQNEMYVEWEQWELNHNPQLVAEIKLLTPILKKIEI
jgi:hypothetical protein